MLVACKTCGLVQRLPSVPVGARAECTRCGFVIRTNKPNSLGRTAAFNPPERREETGMLRVLEPTRPLHDSNQALYVARVSAADPSHRPID